MSPIDNFVRIAMGRDAKDVAFATIYGPAAMDPCNLWSGLLPRICDCSRLVLGLCRASLFFAINSVASKA